MRFNTLIITLSTTEPTQGLWGQERKGGPSWSNSEVLFSSSTAKHLYKLVQTSDIHQTRQAQAKFKLLITASITSTELFINN